MYSAALEKTFVQTEDTLPFNLPFNISNEMLSILAPNTALRSDFDPRHFQNLNCVEIALFEIFYKN